MNDALSGGFAAPPIEAATAFRAMLEAMARPGTIVTLTGAEPPAPLSMAAGVLLLTLADGTTPLHLAGAHDTPAVRDWVTFHCGAPLVGPAEAVLALGRWEALPLAELPIGTPEYPDRSATVIAELSQLSDEGPALRGPGIETTARLSLPETAFFEDNHRLFPLGIDSFLTCGDRLAAVPRSTEIC